MLSLLSLICGFLIGFILGTVLTFIYFRARWSSIKESLKQGETVTNAILDTIKPEKGEFIIRNTIAEYVKENPDATLQDIIEE